VTSIIIGIYPW